MTSNGLLTRGDFSYGCLHCGDACGQFPKHALDVPIQEEAHDAQVVTLIYPHVEGLVFAAEDPSS